MKAWLERFFKKALGDELGGLVANILMDGIAMLILAVILVVGAESLDYIFSFSSRILFVKTLFELLHEGVFILYIVGLLFRTLSRIYNFIRTGK